jgi:hypothetical protein
MFTRLLGRMFFPPRARSHDEGVRLKFARSASIRPKRPIGGSERSPRSSAKPQSHRSGYLTHSAFAAVLRCILSIGAQSPAVQQSTQFSLNENRARKRNWSDGILGLPELWESNEGLAGLGCSLCSAVRFSNLAPTAEFRVWRPPDLTQQLFRCFPRKPLRWVPGCRRTADTFDF